MNQQFEENGFLVIKNFITKKRAKKLSKEFINFCQKNPNECVSDSQVPNTPAKNNYIPFLELLCEKTPKITKVLGEFVLPTYSYSRIYKNKDILEKHTDRDSCEVSLTVHLDGDIEWEIFLQDLNGKVQSITLNSGDALMYSGCTVPHWRDEYEGNFYTQVFLHYVKSKGSKNQYYFDRKEDVTTLKDIHEYIHVIDNIISEDICDQIIERYSNSDKWKDAKISNDKNINKNVRNCEVISISTDQENKDIDHKIFLSINNVFKFLYTKYKTMSVKTDTGYELLKYDKGGFYKQHTDSFENNYREISCSICLNDDYEGGEFAFFDQKIKHKLKKGSAILFPSNFMFPHQILPVTKGTRYSIITWLK